MREAVAFGVRHEALGQLAVGQPAVALLGRAHPRAEVDLVDGHGLDQVAALGELGHVLAVVPAVGGLVDNLGVRGGAQVEAEGVRISLVAEMAFLREDFKLVAAAGLHAGHEKFPDAGPAHGAHGVHAAVPAVEVADDADAAGIGCPHAECDALDAVDGDELGAELLVGVEIIPLAVEPEVEVADGGEEVVGIGGRPRIAVGEVEAELVVVGELGAGDEDAEESVEVEGARVASLRAFRPGSVPRGRRRDARRGRRGRPCRATCPHDSRAAGGDRRWCNERASRTHRDERRRRTRRGYCWPRTR